MAKKPPTMDSFTYFTTQTNNQIIIKHITLPTLPSYRYRAEFYIY